MVRAVIIEDEKLIAAELTKKLLSVSSSVEVVAVLGSVKQAIRYFTDNGQPDLIFSDIQLPDGLSFTIFEQIKCEVPVVFITGYDSFAMNAFEYNGIDYLLKPVEDKDLIKVLDKYNNLEKHFAPRQHVWNLFQKKKERLIVKKGFISVLLRIEDIMFFYTENKVVYVVDKAGRKYISDQNLTDLQNMLDETSFFRANRQYIININYVRSYKAFEKVKLSVDVVGGEQSNPIVISQEMAPSFRKWVSEN